MPSSIRQPASISVVIPAYNAAAFLEQAVASVRGQTLQPEEIFVIDDRSQDATAAVARSLDVNLVECTINAGAGSARNRGIEAARGEWIAFLDADDRWHPQHLALLFGAISSANATLGWTHSTDAPELPPVDLHPRLKIREGPDLMVDMLDSNPVAQTTVVARRDTLLAAGGYSEGARYSEDYELWLKLAPTSRFVEVLTTTCLYRRHPGQTSRATARMYREAWRHRLDALASWDRATAPQQPDLGDRMRVAARRALVADARAIWYAADSESRDVLNAIAEDHAFLQSHWQEVTARLDPWPIARLRCALRPVFHRAKRSF